MAEPPDGPPLYFFFSYARADSEDGPFLARFFQDLRAEVRVRSGHRDADSVGFLDVRSIRPGATWSRELGSALARCRTFVALCSPSFFASEYCGREWSAFEERLRAAERLGRARSALLPVIWTPLRRPPDALAKLQYNHNDLGEAYARFGLRYLLQLNRNHDEYQEFLVALSDRIVRLAEDSPLPPLADVPRFEQVPNAFDPAAGARRPVSPPRSVSPPEAAEPEGVTAVAEQSTGPAEPAVADEARVVPRPLPVSTEAWPRPAPAMGPRRIIFVLAATSADEIATLRRHLDCYGNHFDEWMPYQPHYPQRVCVAAQMVAATQGMISDIVMLDSDVADLLDSSRARNEIVVLLVDMWTAMLEPFRGALAEYDLRNEPTSGVLVPFNPNDAETHENAELLTEVLAATLRNNFLRQDKLFRVNVQSHEEFGRALVEIIVDSQARIFAQQRVFRRPGGSSRRPPFLHGP